MGLLARRVAALGMFSVSERQSEGSASRNGLTPVCWRFFDLRKKTQHALLGAGGGRRGSKEMKEKIDEAAGFEGSVRLNTESDRARGSAAWTVVSRRWECGWWAAMMVLAALSRSQFQLHDNPVRYLTAIEGGSAGEKEILLSGGQRHMSL